MQGCDARRTVGKWLNETPQNPPDHQAIAQLCAAYDLLNSAHLMPDDVRRGWEWLQSVDKPGVFKDRIGPLVAWLRIALAPHEPLAWATHHDEPMLFPTRDEAARYCDDNEQPIPLFARPTL